MKRHPSKKKVQRELAKRLKAQRKAQKRRAKAVRASVHLLTPAPHSPWSSAYRPPEPHDWLQDVFGVRRS